jgi:nucleotide-binding universal stress UspA family protein
MATLDVLRPRHEARPPIGYRHVLVPVTAGAASQRALEVACELAAERGGWVEALAVVEVPVELPLDARMADEESEAHALLARARGVADGFGLQSRLRVERARWAGDAIVAEAIAIGADLVVLGAEPRKRASRVAFPFGRTVRTVLRDAPSRVMLVS